MKPTQKFSSAVQFGNVLPEFTQDQVKNEPMLFSCDTDFASQHGGPITRAFINALPLSFLRGVIDTRVHMLMPGWYPCIPGWHHDDVPRSTSSGQPNYETPEYVSRHCCALVNAEVAPTEFLVGDISVPVPQPGQVVYHVWDEHLEGAGRKDGNRVSAPDRRLIFFDADTFHRGVAAVSTGWRWFGRISIDTARKPANEIRKQVQVYMSAINSGW